MPDGALRKNSFDFETMVVRDMTEDQKAEEIALIVRRVNRVKIHEDDIGNLRNIRIEFLGMLLGVDQATAERLLDEELIRKAEEKFKEAKKYRKIPKQRRKQGVITRLYIRREVPAM